MWRKRKQQLYYAPVIILPSSATRIIFGSFFQSSQHTGDLVRLKLCNDVCTSNYPNPKISPSNQGRRTWLHIHGYNIESLKVTYMCMICRVCVVRTNRKRFFHLSEGGTAKHLRKILSKFSRYCSLYRCQLYSTSYIISDRVISIVCYSLLSKQSKFCCSFLKEIRN